MVHRSSFILPHPHLQLFPLPNLPKLPPKTQNRHKQRHRHRHRQRQRHTLLPNT
ncbi:hypothetical protein DACRYDRAFT_24527, partial [Dacryopinax primogenitus]